MIPRQITLPELQTLIDGLVDLAAQFRGQPEMTSVSINSVFDILHAAKVLTPFAELCASPFGPYKSEYEKGQERANAEKDRLTKLAATPLTAADVLYIAREQILQRAQLRDCPTGERSMAKTVAMFNLYADTNITESQGWQFMTLLKMVRGSQGQFHNDDGIDQTGYSALHAEAAGKGASRQ